MKRRKVFCRGRGCEPGLMFLLPSLAGVVLFVLLPFADAARRSFYNAMGSEFTGLANYKAVVHNEAFQLAVKNTSKFLVVCIPLLLSLSLLVAVLLYAIPQRAGLFKTTFLMPMAMPVATIVLLWQVLFAGQGLLNGQLAAGGWESVNWMGSGSAFWVLVFSYIWKNIGYDIVLWLAGLAAIDGAWYEAARVDGAGAVRIFFQITLPNLRPSLYTILVLSLLNAFKVFREAYLVAGDYPHTSIYLLQHLFNNWFRELSVDKLSAGAVLVAVVSLLLIGLVRRLWDEKGEVQ